MSRFCRRGGGLPKSFRRAANGSIPVIEVATRKKGSLALSLPISTVQTAPDGIESLLRFRHQLTLDVRPPFATPGESPTVEWAVRPGDGSRSSRDMLDLCITGRPPLSLVDRDVDLVTQWSAEPAITNENPWEAWSTDVDDTPETVRRTVNLSQFFRHLVKQMTAAGQAGTTTEPLFQMQYRR